MSEDEKFVNASITNIPVISRVWNKDHIKENEGENNGCLIIYNALKTKNASGTKFKITGEFKCTVIFPGKNNKTVLDQLFLTRGYKEALVNFIATTETFRDLKGVGHTMWCCMSMRKGNKWSSWSYAGKITANSRLGEVKI